ncbi:MAG: nickel pincer cofactor biosynthesis protein LarB [bacterium]|nr:nickel pincer cofactor biosynthesis protein LarB [bacterium]
MDREKIASLLKSVKDGSVSIDEALQRLKTLPYDDIGFAKIDTHRGVRKGFPEVIFCQGKTTDQVTQIFQKMAAGNGQIIATRATSEVFEAIKAVCPGARYNEIASIVTVGQRTTPSSRGMILIISAGTADIPVAEEAAAVAHAMGNTVKRLFDIGVAGIHRLFLNQELLFEARVVVVAAGMEGALASIVGGLVDKPVIAVPTSVGYGASFKGVAALLTMLNSCAPGVAVVNIDNGFGAGYMAGIINKLGEET